MGEIPAYYKYWGKADRSDPTQYHLLPYHCLDVAAVGSVWWESSITIRNAFCEASDYGLEKTRAWILFALALHDIGKFDIRFQRKVPDLWRHLQRPGSSSRLSRADSKKYFHGPSGLFWFEREFENHVLKKTGEPDQSSEDPVDFEWGEEDQMDPAWAAWKPLAEAVTGHHGHIVAAENNLISHLPMDCPVAYADSDKSARECWIDALAELFLKPVGTSLHEIPPALPTIPYLAGFCSVSDWIGSANSEMLFGYNKALNTLSEYFEHKQKDAREALQIAGLVGKPRPYKGVQALIKEEYRPHQVQTMIEYLTNANGLTIIEAPTGSGKTEAALAYAWRLIENGRADSIVFALPSQATANAMLERLDCLATKLFDDHPNLLLAHGNARFNESFSKLCQIRQTAQDTEEEAWAQCSEWLAQSRKRAFLGQIGVSTVDQVLTSVLPVRHRFVRSLGIGRSVLIIDEVHAYDTYMYGLLSAVLESQKAVGGSAILLSATLPQEQRQALFGAWDGSVGNFNVSTTSSYPLISQATSEGLMEYSLPNDQRPPERNVWLETIDAKDAFPPEDLLQRAISAAQCGARVAIITNLVDQAHRVFNKVSSVPRIDTMLFHSRFTLTDRQRIEKSVLEHFGAAATNRKGAILVATQVVEQSLDVDFDWIITQLCPVDLLFQRLGRLHRHSFKDQYRPMDFRSPLCTVILPDGLDYGMHGLIYANTRVMWRTSEKIRDLKENPIVFPDAYRQWVEDVYQKDAWGSEPEKVEAGYREYLDKHQLSQKLAAKMMLSSTNSMTPLLDDDTRVAAVTRDGQMSISIVPYIKTSTGRMLRNGVGYEGLKKIEQAEALALNRVAVPHTWKSALEKYLKSENDIYWLPMTISNDNWATQLGLWDLEYNAKKGLERIK